MRTSYFSQPLREAVSWNATVSALIACWMPSASSWGCELKYIAIIVIYLIFPSASSWGCELKYYHQCRTAHSKRQPLREAVSWNTVPASVLNPVTSQPLREAVSWNVSDSFFNWVDTCQPLREAVSWNNMLMSVHYRALPSASSWGCELKYPKIPLLQWKITSASSWGCELK